MEGEAERVDVGHFAPTAHEAQDEALALLGGQGGEARLDRLLAARQDEAPVLGLGAHVGLEAREHLEARGDRGVRRDGEDRDVVQIAVDAAGEARLVGRGGDVHVARVHLRGALEQVLHGEHRVGLAPLGHELELVAQLGDGGVEALAGQRPRARRDGSAGASRCARRRS
jgi:hypothetical protein